MILNKAEAKKYVDSWFEDIKPKDHKALEIRVTDGELVHIRDIKDIKVVKDEI